MRLTDFRYTHFDEDVVREVTTLLGDLAFTLDRASADRLLLEERDRFVELTRDWVPPGKAGRRSRRLRRLWDRIRLP